MSAVGLMPDDDDRALGMWTIYNSPRDRPGRYVARRWLIGGGEPEPVATADILTAKTLEGVRSMLPPGLVRLARNEADDPVIVETWI